MTPIKLQKYIKKKNIYIYTHTYVHMKETWAIHTSGFWNPSPRICQYCLPMREHIGMGPISARNINEKWDIRANIWKMRLREYTALTLTGIYTANVGPVSSRFHIMSCRVVARTDVNTTSISQRETDNQKSSERRERNLMSWIESQSQLDA